MVRPFSSSFIVLALILAACTTPAGPVRPDLLGTAAPPGAATRTIVITPQTKWVNVTGGETIKFVAGNQVFGWHFDTASVVDNFDLRQIAPPGVFDHQIQAYVAPDPSYLGGDGGGLHGGGMHGGGMHGGGHGGGHR